MKSQVIVVGSYVQDLIFRCAEFPKPGQTTPGIVSMFPGGKGANQAVACARAGASVRFVCAVGRDSYGKIARSLFRSEKISATLLEKPGHATGSAAVILDQNGQNQIVVALGANLALRNKDVPGKIFHGAKIVICQLEVGNSATEHALKSARRMGIVSVLNPAPMPPDFNQRILSQVDILIPNENEFVALLRMVSPPHGNHFSEEKLNGFTDQALHRLTRMLPVETVIVTLGSAGCFVASGDKFKRLAAHRGIRVVDTTGAGDAFVGNFAAAFLTSGDVFQAAEFANAAAALSVTRPGATPSMPRKEQVKRFLNRVRSAS